MSGLWRKLQSPRSTKPHCESTYEGSRYGWTSGVPEIELPCLWGVADRPSGAGVNSWMALAYRNRAIDDANAKTAADTARLRPTLSSLLRRPSLPAAVDTPTAIAARKPRTV